MHKVATRYLQLDPWEIVEKGFHRDRGRVSESIFSLANEYMGVRGYFDEGYSGDSLIGSYLNGVYARKDIKPEWFVGLAKYNCFMINSVNWLYTRISVDGETLDLATSRVTGFIRRLNMRTGVLAREFVWKTSKGKKFKVSFLRFLSMATSNLGGQRISLEALNFSGAVKVTVGLDFSPIHENRKRNFWECARKGVESDIVGIMGRAWGSGQRVFSGFRLTGDAPKTARMVRDEKFIGQTFSLRLRQGVAAVLDKTVINRAEKRSSVSDDRAWAAGIKLAVRCARRSFDEYLAEHTAYWRDVWDRLDITIEGDPENQQGVRFCIFQLHQTYHGVDPKMNVGAKGLTGESYNGQTFWDTETYCLPFYIFNNPDAARNLLGYRYATLPKAVERAGQLDCKGARYPMCTIDGAEHCDTWQHGDLEIHVSAAVSYAVWHYVNVTGDKEFLYSEGIEMLLQISRYYASRGAWSPLTGEFGFWGVMGADEFCMMVHNNCYTNVMAQRTFGWTLDAIAEMKRRAPDLLDKAVKKVGLLPSEPRDWRRMARKMRVLLDRKSGVYEQHDGFFDLPYVDVKKIPLNEFPIYDNWAYVRIFRTGIIKQPDVLLLMFFFSHDYSLEAKRVNYEFYEPRCTHDSSLSPGIHSIVAAELGKHDDALKYSQFACRLDLDDYNRNTHLGLHTTSMAAAWMNMVYGFGGMRSDAKTLSFNPSIPKRWKSFSFRVLYRGSVLSVTVTKTSVVLRTTAGRAIPVTVFGKRYRVVASETDIPLPADRRG